MLWLIDSWKKGMFQVTNPKQQIDLSKQISNIINHHTINVPYVTYKNADNCQLYTIFTYFSAKTRSFIYFFVGKYIFEL